MSLAVAQAAVAQARVETARALAALKPGELHPFEWWDGVAGRWCRGREVPAATLALLPTSERERYEAHLWRWIGMQADEVQR